MFQLFEPIEQGLADLTESLLGLKQWLLVASRGLGQACPDLDQTQLSLLQFARQGKVGLPKSFRFVDTLHPSQPSRIHEVAQVAFGPIQAKGSVEKFSSGSIFDVVRLILSERAQVFTD